MFFLASSSSHASGPVLSMDAPALFGTENWIFPITNSMIQGWLILLGIFIVIRLGTRKMSEVPSGLQNFIEAVVDGLESFTKGMLEPKVVRWAFPLIATFFLFIIISNYSGLLPGVGSIGLGGEAKESCLPYAVDHVAKPFFRPPTADANMTVALGLIFFVMSTIWAVKYNGFFGLVNHIFGVKGGMKGWIVPPLALIFMAVGVIEIISICIRPVALAMRLYGNIYGGESVLTIMLKLVPFGIAAVPFYFFELVICTVQALVFTILTIAFIGTLCSHSDDGHHDEKEAEAHH
ncbi:MAG: F0F1 ATP synthase subunit A [Verrucomicrobiota bacterium]